MRMEWAILEFPVLHAVLVVRAFMQFCINEIVMLLRFGCV